MIFYFTATGNSKFIAERIAVQTGDRIIDIAKCIGSDRFSFDLAPDEAVGIVIPVYFRGIPMIVAEFLQKLSIAKKTETYSYVVLNSGGTEAEAEKFIPSSFQAKAIFDVAAVSNYVSTIKIGSEESIKERLDMAEDEIDEIIEHIKNKHSGVFKNHTNSRYPSLAASLIYPIYKHGRKTTKFTVNESCIGCKLCEKVCPRKIIKIKNGKPVWTASQCEICLGCLHRCPVAAINYGKSAVNGRYLNPRVTWSKTDI